MPGNRQRANWNCPSCGSSNVFHSRGGTFECDECGEEIAERDRSRIAHVSRTAKGKPIGTAVFLNTDELIRLGVNPGKARRIEYEVEDGRLRLTGLAEGDHDGAPG